MPLVKFDGTSANYMRGPYKFSRDKGHKCEVKIEDLKMFTDPSNPDNVLPTGAPRFRVIEEELPTMAEMADKQLASHRIGQFLTKGDAIQFAYDTYGVALHIGNSLPELNQQTAELYKRTVAGVKRKDLIEGLRNASFGEADTNHAEITVEQPVASVDLKVDTTAVMANSDDEKPVPAPEPTDGELSQEELDNIFSDENADKPAAGALNSPSAQLAKETIAKINEPPKTRRIRTSKQVEV